MNIQKYQCHCTELHYPRNMWWSSTKYVTSCSQRGSTSFGVQKYSCKTMLNCRGWTRCIVLSTILKHEHSEFHFYVCLIIICTALIQSSVLSISDGVMGTWSCERDFHILLASGKKYSSPFSFSPGGAISSTSLSPLINHNTPRVKGTVIDIHPKKLVHIPKGEGGGEGISSIV